LQFEAAAHISSLNCAEMTGDRLIDQDNLCMKFSALNIDFNSVSFDPLGSKSPPYNCIKFGYPLQNTRFMLLSTHLAREQLQIDTALLTTFPGVPTSMPLNDL